MPLSIYHFYFYNLLLCRVNTAVIYLHWIANKHYLVLARGLDGDNQFLIGAGHGRSPHIRQGEFSGLSGGEDRRALSVSGVMRVGFCAGEMTTVLG